MSSLIALGPWVLTSAFPGDMDFSFTPDVFILTLLSLAMPICAGFDRTQLGTIGRPIHEIRSAALDFPSCTATRLLFLLLEEPYHSFEDVGGSIRLSDRSSEAAREAEAARLAAANDE